MSTKNTDYLSAIRNTDEDFQSYMVMAFIFLILIIFIGYMIYLSKLEGREVTYMNNLYPSLDGNIRPISINDPDCKYNLYDYYIKTAYNACSGGAYKNDFVDIANLKAVLKQGVRGLDFEIYSVNNQPVVATSTSEDYFVKETFNSVNFGTVMDTIQNYAFSGGTCPNPTDPLIIHLRIKSNNQEMYSNLANIFKSYDSIMLGKEYSFENSGRNLGSTPLLSLQNKVILIVDKLNNAFLENEAFLEYVNLTSNSVFMRAFNYYDVKNSPDTQELTEYNKRDMTIVFPDKGTSPANPSGFLCRAYGCQMIAMRYQLVDNFLMENALFFDRASYAFALKPENLRYIPVTIPTPTPQNPAYSYATRNASTDYYSFNF
jgi:Phosphatidylinositol-specific phospholipase C, X domain